MIARVRLSRLSIRLVVAAGLTGYMLWKAHPRDVAAIATRAEWQPMLVAVGLVLADRALMAYRWLALLCTVEANRRPPLWVVMRVFFVSTFVGTFLPMSVGGDMVRSYSITRFNVSGGDAVASVLMDRVLGVASILLVGLVGVMLVADLAGNAGVLILLAVALAVCGLVFLLVFSRRTAALALILIARMPGAILRHGGDRLLESVRKYAGFRGQLMIVLACSVGVQILRIVQAYYLGRGLGIDVPLVAYFGFIPVILLIMLVPITFNGIGTSQAAFVWLFARAGTPSSAAFALSVLFVALGIVGNLPGGILYAVGGLTGQDERGVQVTL